MVPSFAYTSPTSLFYYNAPSPAAIVMTTVTVQNVKCEQRCFCHSVNTALRADPALYTTMCYLGIYYDITTKKPLALSPWIYARPIVIGGNWATNKTIATDNFNSYLIICHKTPLLPPTLHFVRRIGISGLPAEHLQP